MKKIKIDKETKKKIDKGIKEIEEGKYVSFEELKKSSRKDRVLYFQNKKSARRSSYRFLF